MENKELKRILRARLLKHQSKGLSHTLDSINLEMEFLNCYNLHFASCFKDDFLDVQDINGNRICVLEVRDLTSREKDYIKHNYDIVIFGESGKLKGWLPSSKVTLKFQQSKILLLPSFLDFKTKEEKDPLLMMWDYRANAWYTGEGFNQSDKDLEFVRKVLEEEY